MPKVTFLNEAVTVEVAAGSTIEQAAKAAHVKLFEGFWQSYHCSGKGRCLGKGCRVWVNESSPAALAPKTFWERIRRRLTGAMRLACQARVQGDVEVRTATGTLHEVEPNMKWDPDPAPARWKERLAP